MKTHQMLEVLRPFIGITLGVMILFLLYFILPRKEGFSSGKTPKDTDSIINSTKSTLKDLLNIPTYRSSYESKIQDLETWANYNMLNLLAQAKIGTDATTTSFDSVQQFNALAEFKKNLDAFLDVVDKME